MCLVVDANCFGSVFNPKAQEHKRFAPIYRWLWHGTGGKLIYGGTKYKKEINLGLRKYLPILTELERKHRFVSVDDEAVDQMAIVIRKIVGNIKDFDDEHLIALIAVSKCCVICTDDKRADPYLKRRDLYPIGVKPPKIYRSLRNKGIFLQKGCCHNL